MANLEEISKKYSIPRTTLERYMKTNKIVPTKGHSICMGKDLELELVDNKLALERRNFGMTNDDVREFCYKISMSNNLIDGNERKKLSRHGYYGIMNRHKQLSLRIGERKKMKKSKKNLQ